jgi:cell division protein YceG involved in septum cleavage
MKKKIKIIVPLLLVIILVAVGGLSWFRLRQDKFAAPRSEAPEVKFRVSKENTIMAVTGNLHYYGFVKDEDALLYALKHTQDNTPGKEGAIKVGNNTIDTEAVYAISQTMTAWEIAKILLNEGTYSPNDCSHGCPKPIPLSQRSSQVEMLPFRSRSRCGLNMTG